jgi:hypothetical protein
MDKRTIEFLQDVLISVHENLHELNERRNFAEPHELTYIEAKIMAYTEMIAILKTSADQFGIPKEEIGL